jgi:RNA polymerase sigma-70 factor, ECF subfamily
MNEQERHSLFSELITRHRSELYGYIFAVVRSWEDADDLFQSVSLVLWSKFEQFRPDSDFFAWARQTAKNKIGDHLRGRRQPNFVNVALLDTLTDLAQDEEPAEPYLAALRRCREKLPVADEQLLDLHYGEGLGSRQLADKLQRSQPSICRSLNRIRSWLLHCVQMDAARQDHSGKEPS